MSGSNGNGGPIAPPQSLEAEQSVLGAVLLSDTALPALVEQAHLQPDDFYREGHARIYQAMCDMRGAGAPVDALTLIEYLEQAGALDDVGGRATIDLLAGSVPAVGNVLQYARIVRDKAILRRLLRASYEIQARVHSHEAPPHELVEVAARAISDVADAAQVPDLHARRRRDLTQLIAMADTTPPWRCEGLAADGHLTTLVGRGGEGKSIVTLALAGAVQLGSTLAGMQCKRGRVVIFDAENGDWIMGSRMKAAGTPTHALEVYDAEGLDLARHRAWIAARCEGADLVIFDSIRTLAPGAKENDSDDMAPVMGAMRYIARSTGAAVIAIHHRGKGDGDFRGSSAVRDQTDLMFVLEREPQDPEKRWRRALRCAKCRIAEEPPTRWLGIRHWHGELTLTEAAPYDDAPVRHDLEEQILGIIADKGPITRGDVAVILDRDRKDQTVRRALAELTEDGQVEKISGHRYITAAAGGASLPLAPPDTLTPVGVSPLKKEEADTPSEAGA